MSQPICVTPQPLCFLLSLSLPVIFHTDSTDGDPAFFRPVRATVYGSGWGLADLGR